MRSPEHGLSLFASFVNLVLACGHRIDPCTIIGDGRVGGETESCAESPLRNSTWSLHQRSSCAALGSWSAHQGSSKSIDVLGFSSWLSQLSTMVAYWGEIAVSINCFSHLHFSLGSASGMSSKRLIDVAPPCCSPVPSTVLDCRQHSLRSSARLNFSWRIHAVLD